MTAKNLRHTITAITSVQMCLYIVLKGYIASELGHKGELWSRDTLGLVMFLTLYVVNVFKIKD